MSAFPHSFIKYYVYGGFEITLDEKNDEIGILEALDTPIFTIEEVRKMFECEKTLLATKPITREVYTSQLEMINTIKKQFEVAFNGKCKKL